MTDTANALDRWQAYDKSHGWVVENWADILLWLDRHNEAVRTSLCIGWAHQELVRRGYSIMTGDDGTPMPGGKANSGCWVNVCKMFVGIAAAEPCTYPGPAFLDCYLAAIEATEATEKGGHNA